MEKLCAQLWWQLRHVTQCLHVNTFSSQTLGNYDVNSAQSLCVTVMTITTNGDVCSSKTVVAVRITPVIDNKVGHIDIVDGVIISIVAISVIVALINMITKEEEQTNNANDLSSVCQHKLGSSSDISMNSTLKAAQITHLCSNAAKMQRKCAGKVQGNCREARINWCSKTAKKSPGKCRKTAG